MALRQITKCVGLVPCPMCGCQPELQFSPATPWENILGDIMPGKDRYSITCRSSAENNYLEHIISVGALTEEQAKNNWNKRWINPDII